MGRGTTKKNQVERRKKPRGRSSASRKVVAPRKSPASDVSSTTSGASVARAAPEQDACYHCSKDLVKRERALFVEEEVGRVFCSESCITAFFAPEIERLEKEYMRRLVPGDLTGEERESYAHLRFITLQEPDEVWREKTLSGDHRYTLISEFEPGKKSVWSICICLFLRGEPSFLFIAFTTRNTAMVNAYRRGERVQWDRREGKNKSKKLTKSKTEEAGAEVEGGVPGELGDRLADAWTEDETFLAQVSSQRSAQDIPVEEFEKYQSCLEETLEAPDEVWSVEMTEPEGVHLYHFIRHYPNQESGHWYVILARETDDEEQIEILDAFPTRDANLVEQYRRGTQEVGETPETRPASRWVH